MQRYYVIYQKVEYLSRAPIPIQLSQAFNNGRYDRATFQNID